MAEWLMPRHLAVNQPHSEYHPSLVDAYHLHDWLPRRFWRYRHYQMYNLDKMPFF